MKATTLLCSVLSSLVLCAAQAYNKRDGEVYDFLVIGSGPGGAPLASRLARAGHSVLLIDAGDDEGDRLTQQIPGLQGQATEDENYRWDYFVEMYDDAAVRKKNSRATYQRPDGTLYTGLNPPSDTEALGLLYPRSGTLGGCAAHNAMIFLYPWERDWKYMQQLTGNYSSWDPARMRGYFEKVENAQYVPNSVVGHGFSGWLHVSLTALDIVVEDIKLLGTVLGAVKAAGNSLPDLGLGRLLGGVLSIPETVTTLARLLLTDMNSPDPGRDTRLGVWQVPIAVDPSNSHRATPRNLVLDTAKSYPLTLRLNTLVTKIIFDKSGPRPRAIGVDYLQGKSLYAADPRYKKTNEAKSGRVYARHEVIISTGTYSTPQLLKLSGIGPKQELERWGIPVVHDLPGVGENLQDRYEGVVISQSTSNYSIIEKCTFLRTGAQDPCYQTWKNGVTPYTRGVYGSNGLALGITYRSSVSDGPEPDLFMSGVPVPFKGYYPDWATEGTQLSHFWSWYMLKARTANRAGSVTLRSTDPQDTPRISFRTLGRDTLGDRDDQNDLQAMYEGFLHMRTMVDDFVPLDGSSFTEVFPGRDVQSEKDIKEHLMNEAWGHHCGGTAAIGADDDRMAVLDSDHRVRGVDGLRVVDASTYSRIPGFFIVSWVYIISERAADIIIHEYK